MVKKMARPETLEEREAGATVVAEVTGPLPIRDAVTRESVETGGTVRLNPAKTLVQALVDAGSIKVLPTPKGKPSTPPAA